MKNTDKKNGAEKMLQKKQFTEPSDRLQCKWWMELNVWRKKLDIENTHACDCTAP
jgi:hypothetical protein